MIKTRDFCHHPNVSGISFLNEVTRRYPDAISFAPGAPDPEALLGIDVSAAIDAFLSHIGTSQDLRPEETILLTREYGPSAGIINELIGKALTNDKTADIDGRSIVVTVGAQEAIFLAMSAILEPGQDALAFSEASYVGLLGAARVLGVQMIEIPEGDDGICLKILEERCMRAAREGGRIRLLYVAPDYANPSGSLMPLIARHELLRLADNMDFYVLEDITYRFTTNLNCQLPSLKSLAPERVILVGTFSKIGFPGLRVGFLGLGQDTESGGKKRSLSDAIADVKGMITGNTSPACQAVVGGLLIQSNLSMNAMAAELGKLYRRRLASLLVALDSAFPADLKGVLGVSWSQPSGGFFVVMNLPFAVDDRLAADCARNFGVLWTPLSLFRSSEVKSSAIRLSCSSVAVDKMAEGALRLRLFIESVLASKAGEAVPAG